MEQLKDDAVSDLGLRRIKTWGRIKIWAAVAGLRRYGPTISR